MISEKLYYEFLKPDFVYIPFNDRTLLDIKLNMDLKCNKLLGKLTNGNNIYSTCSGKLIDFCEINTVDGKTNSMVIENDYRDKRSKLVGMRRNLQTYSKEELITTLNEYSLNYFNNEKNLIVLIEHAKNIDNSDSYTLKENIDGILETLDVLNIKLGLNITIVVNSNDTISKDVISDFIGTYPNLYYEIVNKEYISSNYNILIKKIYNTKTLVLTLDKIYEIYFAIKKNKCLTNKVITVVQNKKLLNVNVKIGTKVNELLKFLDIESENVELLKEKIVKVNANDSIITKDLKAIICL